MAHRRRTARSGTLRTIVRGAAGAAVAAAFVVPLTRKRSRVPAAVTTAACAGGPLGLAVLAPRTRIRDVAMYALQMWGFTMVHELPYDDPEALRARLQIRFPIEVDRKLGAGRLPNARLQKALSDPASNSTLDRFLTWVHWLWFLEPHSSLVYILARDYEGFPRAARQMAAVYDLGCAGYFAVPTAPPWWSSDEGHTPEQVRRIMVEVGEEFWGDAWPKMYDALGGNPWAAMPSLHFAASLMAAHLLAETGPVAGAIGWGYALTLGFALVYLGEHYVTDVLAGAALVAAVRNGEEIAEPFVLAVSTALQHLEAVATS